MFLVIVDACSKWMDAYTVHRVTTQATMEKLQSSFAVYGLPDILVSDNASSFTSAEFKRFCAVR